VNLLALYTESIYGHTLWITDRGKIIDLSRDHRVHWDWAKDNLDKFKYNDYPNMSIYAVTSKSGWIRTQNHPRDLSFVGRKKDIKKHRSVILDIVDSKLFKLDKKWWVDVSFVDDNGDDIDNKRHSFSMPEDDSKFRRFV
jgi:hypothetical protein